MPWYVGRLLGVERRQAQSVGVSIGRDVYSSPSSCGVRPATTTTKSAALTALMTALRSPEVVFVAVVTLTDPPVQEVPDGDGFPLGIVGGTGLPSAPTTAPPVAVQNPAKGPTDLAGSG